MFYGTTLILHELTEKPFHPQSPILVANLASRMFRVTRMRYIFAFFRKREVASTSHCDAHALLDVVPCCPYDKGIMQR